MKFLARPSWPCSCHSAWRWPSPCFFCLWLCQLFARCAASRWCGARNCPPWEKEECWLLRCPRSPCLWFATHPTTPHTSWGLWWGRTWSGGRTLCWRAPVTYSWTLWSCWCYLQSCQEASWEESVDGKASSATGGVLGTGVKPSVKLQKLDHQLSHLRGANLGLRWPESVTRKLWNKFKRRNGVKTFSLIWPRFMHQ